MQPWIAFTLLAALMQAVRTAGQKSLSATLSPMGTTFVRYLFGLPFVMLYLVYITDADPLPPIVQAAESPRFLVYAAIASVAQIVATVLLVMVFGRRNFTVATSFVKTEAVQAAVFGALFFGSALSPLGWLAVLVGFAGIFIVGLPPAGARWDLRNVALGTLSGAAFALTSLWLREASLGINREISLPIVASAALTLFYMVTMQSLLCLAWILAGERAQLAAITRRLPLALFVGLTSALGSVGWFTAMSYQNPALVKSLGQIEFVFTMLLTSHFFRERTTSREYAGVLAIVASVLLLLLI